MFLDPNGWAPAIELFVGMPFLVSYMCVCSAQEHLCICEPNRWPIEKRKRTKEWWSLGYSILGWWSHHQVVPLGRAGRRDSGFFREEPKRPPSVSEAREGLCSTLLSVAWLLHPGLHRELVDHGSSMSGPSCKHRAVADENEQDHDDDLDNHWRGNGGLQLSVW